MYAALTLHLSSWLLMASLLLPSLALSETKLPGGTITIGGSETPAPVPEMPSPGTIDQGTPPKLPTRQKSQAQAAAMAAMAASMQQIACMAMMQEAMKSGDKMMMAMAAMQCGQAAQTMANAAKNKEDSEKMTTEPGKAPSMKLGEFKNPQAGKDQGSVTNSGATLVTAESDPLPDPEVLPTTEVASFTKAPEPAPAETPPPAAVIGDFELGTIPNTIERARLGYDESGKSGSLPTPERQLASGTSQASSKPADGNNTAKEAGSDAGGVSSKTRGKRGVDSEEVAGAGGGGAGSSDEPRSDDGSNPLDAMLALLGPKPEEEGPSPNGQDIVALKGQDKSKPPPTIFEYATYRFKKAAYDDGRIRVRTLKRAAVDKNPVLARQSAESP